MDSGCWYGCVVLLFSFLVETDQVRAQGMRWRHNRLSVKLRREVITNFDIKFVLLAGFKFYAYLTEDPPPWWIQAGECGNSKSQLFKYGECDDDVRPGRGTGCTTSTCGPCAGPLTIQRGRW